MIKVFTYFLLIIIVFSACGPSKKAVSNFTKEKQPFKPGYFDSTSPYPPDFPYILLAGTTFHCFFQEHQSSETGKIFKEEYLEPNIIQFQDSSFKINSFKPITPSKKGNLLYSGGKYEYRLFVNYFSFDSLIFTSTNLAYHPVKDTLTPSLEKNYCRKADPVAEDVEITGRWFLVNEEEKLINELGFEIVEPEITDTVDFFENNIASMRSSDMVVNFNFSFNRETKILLFDLHHPELKFRGRFMFDEDWKFNVHPENENKLILIPTSESADYKQLTLIRKD